MANKTAKKNAKMGHNRGKAHEEVAASQIVMITGTGHRVTKDSQTTSDCGRPRVGWRFGTAADVTCQHCIEGLNYKVALLPEVPPRLPDDLSELPVLDMEAFDEAHPA